MSSPLRIEFPGAIHHMTSSGDRRETIDRDETDRIAHRGVLRAYRHAGLTMTKIARHLGLSVSRVSRLIARQEASGKT